MIPAAKILDGLAWMLGALGMIWGLVSVTFIGLGSFVWLYQGQSFLSLVWTFSQPSMLRDMADLPAHVLLLSLSAIALAGRRRERPPRISMAASAQLFARCGLYCAGFVAVVIALFFAGRLAFFAGL